MIDSDLVERSNQLTDGRRALVPGPGRRGVLLAGPFGAGTTAVAAAIAAELTRDGTTVCDWPPTPDAEVVSIDARRIGNVDGTTLDFWLRANPAARLIVGARSGSSLPSWLTALWSSGAIERIEVPPLGTGGVEHMASALLGGPLSRGLVDYLWRSSGGLPLLVRELVADARNDGSIVTSGRAYAWAGDPSTVGPRLRHLARSRIDELAEPMRTTLDVIACSGGAPVRTVLDLVTPEALDACERVGLISTDGDGIVRIEPPAFELAIRDSMPVGRRTTLRRRLSDAIASDDDVPDEFIVRAGTWSLDEGVRPPANLAIAAATAANRNGDYRSARRLAASAVGSDLDLDARLALAHAARFGGAPLDVMVIIDTEHSDQRFREASAILTADVQQFELDDVDAAVVTLGTTNDASGRLDVYRLAHLGYAGRFEECVPEMLAVVNDPTSTDEQRCIVWPPLVTGLAFSGRSQEAITHAQRAVAVAPRVADQLPFVRSLAASAMFFARLLGGWGLDDMPPVGPLALTGVMQLGLGLPLLANGQTPRAVVEIDKALAALDVDDPFGFRSLALAAGSAASVLSGEEERGIAMLAQAERVPRRIGRLLSPEIDRMLLWPTFFRGGAGQVASAGGALVADCERRGLWAAALAARHTMLRLGVTNTVPDEEALSLADGPSASAITTQFRALRDADADALVEASEIFESIDAVVAAAEAAAQAHYLAKGDGRRATARAAELRVRRLTDGIDTTPYPLLRDWTATHRLTRREREVVALAAQQLTNREIAARLRTSQRTVEGHLHRAYTKLGVDDRSRLRADVADAREADPR